MIKDLEKILEQLNIDGNYDAESAIMQFGHGDCHELTWALNQKFGSEMIAIVGQDSGMPVHSCILINDKLTLDAYGINEIEATLKRYNELCEINLSESATYKKVSVE